MAKFIMASMPMRFESPVATMVRMPSTESGWVNEAA